MAANQLIDFFENGNIVNAVNSPSLEFGTQHSVSLCCGQERTQDARAVVLSVLADMEINVVDMLNKSR